MNIRLECVGGGCGLTTFMSCGVRVLWWGGGGGGGGC